jgi:hypothetical protein
MWLVGVRENAELADVPDVFVIVTLTMGLLAE